MTETLEQNSAHAIALVEAGRATQWKPGQSGNQPGRQAEALLRKRLQMAADHAPPGMTALEAAMNSLAVVAQRPDHPAWRAAIAMVLERVDGAVPKTLRIEGELPLKVTIRGDRD